VITHATFIRGRIRWKRIDSENLKIVICTVGSCTDAQIAHLSSTSTLLHEGPREAHQNAIRSSSHVVLFPIFSQRTEAVPDDSRWFPRRQNFNSPTRSILHGLGAQIGRHREQILANILGTFLLGFLVFLIVDSLRFLTRCVTPFMVVFFTRVFQFLV
jgi:hypothetical protein